MLDAEICYRASRARDKRFDGRFFICVRSTRIFCRTTCPVPLPKKENVEFLPSAAAAQAMGYRPCLRCRPETAPNTPAWRGSSTTVSKALRLIEEGALNRASVAELAEDLGVSERHLRRLFQKHLGATPRQVAASERILLAKRLLDEASLSITEVAMASGFRSQRRFNDVIRSVYDRSPTELRKRRKHHGLRHLELGIPVRLPYRPPYNWRRMYEFLAARAIPGVEEVVDQTYRRVISIDGATGFLAVEHASNDSALRAQLQLPTRVELMPLVGRLKRQFDIEADSETIDAELSKDSRLRPLVKRAPGTRVPGSWDGFELGVRAIVGQQISVSAASTIVGRIADKFGTPVSSPPSFESDLTTSFPSAETLAEADLRGLGMPDSRAETVRLFAAAVANSTFDLGTLGSEGADVNALRAIRGIGSWTASYIAMRVAGDPDVFLETDLGVLRSLARDGRRPSSKEALEIAEAWRPWRAYGVLYLWQ